jgi:hypothetical protein
MRRSSGKFAFGLLLSVALPAGAAMASDPAEQLMLERADYWRMQHRLDVVSDILNKILAANPRQPDALYQQTLLAMERGDRGGAQQYLDRLQQLAPADPRAAELIGEIAQSETVAAAAPEQAAASAAPASSTAPAVPHAEAPNFAPTSADSPDFASRKPPAPAFAAAKPPAPPPTSPAPPRPETLGVVPASADSEDLAPRKAAAPVRALAAASPRVVPGPSVAQAGTVSQDTVSDAVAPAAAPVAAAALAGVSNLGITARQVQVAQVEIEPPPPIVGYQPLGALRPYSPADTLEVDIERDLAKLEQTINPTLTVGLGYRTHSGTEGTSSFNEVGMPFEASFSPWYTGMMRIDVVPVYVDAGTPANINLGRFGANPLTYLSAAGPVQAGGQNATGVGLQGSYTWTDFSAQVGTTPLGFPITNVIGELAVRIEGLRQPVTDSVLSYAGTHADFSKSNVVAPGALGNNPLWGGVVKTGPHISVFYDNQFFGAYGGAGYSWLDGTNVAHNEAVDALLGAYFRPIKTDDWALRVGVSLYYTSYDKDLFGFAYGEGGYFSPQNFEGVGFPIEVTGHTGPWTYLASTTLGFQHFNQDSSPTFPNNPSAQAALVATSPSLATLTGVNSGIGFGYNFKGQVEYAIDPTASLGLAGSLNNGNGYTEGIVQLYLRKTFDWFAPVAINNNPESIAARDMPGSHL